MESVQSASRGGTGARPITAWTRRIARDLEARAADAPIVDRAQIYRVIDQARAALGLRTAALETLRHCISYSRPDDWKPNRRPVVWPSNRKLAEDAGVSVGAIKARLRQLTGLGLIVPRDSGHGRRTGRRDESGEASSAFGLDLSPLRTRYTQLAELAAAYTAQSRLFERGRLEIGRMKRLVGQVLAQAGDMKLTGGHWLRLEHRLDAIVTAADAAKASRDDAVYGRVLAELEELEALVADTVDQFMFPENIDGSGSKNGPDIQLQTIPHSNLVHARRDCSPRGQASRETIEVDATPSGSVFKTRPEELVELFPVTAMYVGSPRPRWPDLHRTASDLRKALGVRIGTWVDAVECLGIDAATIAIMITAEREGRNEIRLTAGAYFAGMIAKAKKGELDLAKSLWGFRSQGVTKQ